jgi:hypothetical protein
MSFQPTSTNVLPPPNSAPAAVAKRRKIPTLLGLVALVAGVVGAVVLFMASRNATSASVEKFARAPVNCTTSLRFSETGEYLFFIETKGEVGDIGGDCDQAEERYDSVGEEPDVDLTLTFDDDEIDFDRADDVSYNTDRFVGVAESVADISQTGSYRLRVESDDDEFAIAVGRDPAGRVSMLRNAAIGSAVGGLVVGGGLLLMGRKRAAPPSPMSGSMVPNVGPSMLSEPPYTSAPPVSMPGHPMPPPPGTPPMTSAPAMPSAPGSLPAPPAPGSMPGMTPLQVPPVGTPPAPDSWSMPPPAPPAPASAEPFSFDSNPGWPTAPSEPSAEPTDSMPTAEWPQADAPPQSPDAPPPPD